MSWEYSATNLGKKLYFNLQGPRPPEPRCTPKDGGRGKQTSLVKDTH